MWIFLGFKDADKILAALALAFAAGSIFHALISDQCLQRMWVWRGERNKWTIVVMFIAFSLEYGLAVVKHNFDIKRLGKEVCLAVRDKPKTREQIFDRVGRVDISRIDEALQKIHEKITPIVVSRTISLDGFNAPFPVRYRVYYKKPKVKC